MSQKLYDIPLKSIEGKSLTLELYKGKVLLIVNVASKCGLTPQYEGLEALYGNSEEDFLILAKYPDSTRRVFR